MLLVQRIVYRPYAGPYEVAAKVFRLKGAVSSRPLFTNNVVYVNTLITRYAICYSRIRYCRDCCGAVVATYM
jgi:hypothetical protein